MKTDKEELEENDILNDHRCVALKKEIYAKMDEQISQAKDEIKKYIDEKLDEITETVSKLFNDLKKK